MKYLAGYLIPRTSTEDLRPTNPDSNPRPDIKILGRECKSSAESFRYADGYLKLRYQTGCSNQPQYFSTISESWMFLLSIFIPYVISRTLITKAQKSNVSLSVSTSSNCFRILSKNIT